VFTGYLSADSPDHFFSYIKYT